MIQDARSTRRRPWRLPRAEVGIPADIAPVDGTALVAAGPEGVGGEFDTLIDPRFPIYTASNLSEAFPGPMTPLSLELTLESMRGSSRCSAQLFRLEEPIATELLRSVSVFAHRVYGGVSVLRELAAVMPGWSAEEIDQQYLGIPLPEGGQRSRPSLGGIARGTRIGGTVGLLAAGFGRQVDEVVTRAHALTVDPEQLAQLDDRGLAARLELLRGEVVQAWQVSTFGTVLAGGVLSAIEKAGGVPVRSGSDARRLESVGALAGVSAIAVRAVEDEAVAGVLRAESADAALATLRERSSWFATAIDDLVREVGHRGPGETELANPMFADAPALLVESVAKAIDAPGRTVVTQDLSRRERLLARVAHRAMLTRERSRDAVVRMTHALRLTVRERARRLVVSGTLEDADDVWYLTFAELRDPPDGVAATVARRRAERVRLGALRLPAMFDGHWMPEVGVGDRLEQGESISGIPASPGIVRGPVRLLSPSTLADLEPGEVLVAATTDTGWTPLFAFASAIVTDVGAQISHAAVVAREFGIPAVVGTRSATSRLRDGQRVEVDGAAGVVTAID